jgi:nicotinate-nucleotide adenylyltransferase
MSGGRTAARAGAALARERPARARRAARAKNATIGMLGGTFDPIHVGHLALAESARLELGLDEILFVPAGRPPHKRGHRITSARHRLAMVELATDGRPGFAVSRIEIDRAGPSYTIDTVEALLAKAAAADRPIELTVILSAESFTDLPTWHEPDRLLRLARIAVAPRPGHPAPAREHLMELLPGVSDRVVVLNGPHLDVSASAIRARVAAGLPIDGLVPPAVAAYIEAHALYRESP